ncbi:cyclic nucleotide-binding domain-containing protein [Actibacterium sp. MT2.3-13A]|uniref:cyclic nucleotide-binding domain-containing protein n=1 Tax=Actibacterium sp. MT2.3-13A TaxID=2828332 RepID=UPI001BAB0223|nr:cyclic nucleotide-binding domain-containing protein [Actibacterium sp. MT2.3-13A]
MKEKDFEGIRSLPLFHEMEEENFQELMRVAYFQTFPPQIELISEGEPSDFLHIVADGMVELFSNWNNRETTMAIVRPVGTFILAATVRDAPYLMSARTLEKSRIVLLPSQDVRAVFDKDNAFARAVVTELAACYRSVIKASKNLKLRTSTERLANYMLRRQELAGGAPSFELPIEKRKIASQLGMTPENLSRALRTLGEYGLEIDGLKVTIADRDDLTRFAKPTPLIDDPGT